MDIVDDPSDQKLRYPSAEVHGSVGHQGDGDHHGHEGSQRQPPHPLQHFHHEEADHYDGGLDLNITQKMFTKMSQQTAWPMKPKAEHILNMPGFFESMHSIIQVYFCLTRLSFVQGHLY